MKLVFIHGAAEGSWIWEKQISFFKDSIAIDLPGHGEKEDEQIDSIEGYAEWVMKEIEKMGLDRVMLIGHSMGGAITMVIALKKPKWLDSIVLIATGARLRVSKMILHSLNSSIEEAFRLLSLMNLGYEPDLEILNKFKDNFIKVKLEVARRDFLACNNFDYMEKVSEIDLPTLIICGDKDLLTPLKYHEYLNRKIKNSKLVIIKDAGHMVMLEKPYEVNNSIYIFLKERIYIKNYL